MGKTWKERRRKRRTVGKLEEKNDMKPFSCSRESYTLYSGYSLSCFRYYSLDGSETHESFKRNLSIQD